MFYKTNAHLLEMLKNLKFIPSDKDTLEAIINSTKTAGTFNRYFEMYREWFNKVYSTNVEKGKKELLSLCNISYLYYEYLYKYILNTQSFKEVYAALAQLYHQQNSTSQINPQQSTEVSKLFDLLERVFGYRSDCVKPLKLKSEITLEEIATIYKKHTSLLSELFSAICSLEDRIIQDNWTDWKCNVLGDKALAQLPLNNKLEIQDPSIIIVSFCSNTNKMLFSSQKMISAMLISSDSRQSFGNRAFGFMYGAKFEDIVAMSFSDVYSSTEKLVTVNDLHNAILRGLPLVSLEYVLESIPTDLLPIDNLNKLLNKTDKHNEILLTPDSEPYGIFVYKEQLDKCFSQVCSLCTVMQLPLFISKQDGSMLILPWQNVFEDVQSLPI